MAVVGGPEAAYNGVAYNGVAYNGVAYNGVAYRGRLINWSNIQCQSAFYSGGTHT